jgi:hypothetical protein
MAQYYNKYSALIINTNVITEVWEHFHIFKFTVDVDGLWQPEFNKHQDNVIMEALVASGRFKNKEMKEITYCRISSCIIHIGHKELRRKQY